MPETDDELTRSYWSAAYHSSWYSGNNPGKQKRLSEDAARLGQVMRKRGLDTSEINLRVEDGQMPPFASQGGEPK